jgi:hypothetical protein
LGVNESLQVGKICERYVATQGVYYVKLQKGRPSCSCSMKVDIIDNMTY